MMPRHLRVFLPLLALLVLSCSQPDSYEQFIRAKDAPSGVYSFDLDLSDSTCLYDFSFYLRSDKPSLWSRAKDRPVALDIVWTAPSGESWPERVYLNSGDERGRVALYRRDCVPEEPGCWTLQVTPRDTDKGWRGLGIICHRHGTR